MVMAFVDTSEFLKNNLARDTKKWAWRNVHSNTYPNTPWSKTPLKFIFHREIPTGGNTQTPNVAKTSTNRASQENYFTTTHTGNLKMLVALAKKSEDEVNLISIDTGNGGNIFQPHYFDMNRNHLDGKLAKLIIGR